MTKDEAVSQRHAWALCLMRAIETYPKTSPVYIAAGSLAWGRYDDEPQPGEKVARVIAGLGFLKGARWVLLGMARVLGTQTEPLANVPFAVDEHIRRFRT